MGGARARQAVRRAGQRYRRPERRRRALEGGLELRAAARRLGVGEPGDGDRALAGGDRVAAEARREAVGVERLARGAVAADYERGDGRGPRPAGEPREVLDLLDAHVVAREQPRQCAAPALALALGRGALLRVALDAGGADAVDVAEDRAREAVERRPPVARPPPP